MTIFNLLQQERELTARAHQPPRELTAQIDFMVQLHLDSVRVEEGIINWLTCNVPRSLLVEAAEGLADCEALDVDYNAYMDNLLAGGE